MYKYIIVLGLAVFMFSGCSRQSEKSMAENQATDLYLEVIQTKDGTFRFGIAHPDASSEKGMYMFEAELPAAGASHAIKINEQAINVFVRFRKEE